MPWEPPAAEELQRLLPQFSITGFLGRGGMGAVYRAKKIADAKYGDQGCPAIGKEPCEIECKGVYRKKGFTGNIESWNATFAFASGLKMVFTDQHHFPSCMRSRKDPVSGIDATHVASYLGLNSEIAARLETKLKSDPKQEKFIGNDEANKRLSRPMHNGWKL